MRDQTQVDGMAKTLYGSGLINEDTATTTTTTTTTTVASSTKQETPTLITRTD